MLYVIPLKGTALATVWRRAGSVQPGATWREVRPGLSPGPTARLPPSPCILRPPPASILCPQAAGASHTQHLALAPPGARGQARGTSLSCLSGHSLALEDVGPASVHCRPSFLAISGAMSSW